jgi:hypothetical protein
VYTEVRMSGGDCMVFNILFIVTALGILTYVGYVVPRLLRYQYIQNQRQHNSDERRLRKLELMRTDLRPPGITSSISQAEIQAIYRNDFPYGVTGSIKVDNQPRGFIWGTDDY